MNKLTKTTTIIELHVPSFDIVKEFYGNLGFKILWEYPSKNQDGYLVMKLEENLLTFFCGSEEVYNQQYFKSFPKTTPRGYSVEVGIFITEDIKLYYEKFKNKYEENIVEKLRLQAWGNRDFRIVDPFGFYLRISEPTDMSKP